MVYRLQGWQTTTIPAFGGNAADTPAALPPAQVPAVRSRGSTPSLRRPPDRERCCAVPAGSTCRNQNRPIVGPRSRLPLGPGNPRSIPLSGRVLGYAEAPCETPLQSALRVFRLACLRPSLAPTASGDRTSV